VVKLSERGPVPDADEGHARVDAASVDRVLGGDVDRRRRLVEDHDGRTAKEDATEAETYFCHT
jgi:hypothetical protein